jgi:hypothetical protein
LLAQQRARREQRCRAAAPRSPPPAALHRKRFFVGQWIDAKDTVNQWLEATVLRLSDARDPEGDGLRPYDSDGGFGRPLIELMDCHDRERTSGGKAALSKAAHEAEEAAEAADVEDAAALLAEEEPEGAAEGGGGGEAAAAEPNSAVARTAVSVPPVEARGPHVYVHYNGWPARWDEWIPVDSPRLAPFRTRTIHSVLQSHLSPEPAAWLPNAPATGSGALFISFVFIHFVCSYSFVCSLLCCFLCCSFLLIRRVRGCFVAARFDDARQGATRCAPL